MFGKKRARRKGQTKQPYSFALQIVFGVVAFLVIALVVYGIYYVTRIESLQIKAVEVYGGETIAHDTIREKAETALSGAYVRLIPKRFSWTYPKNAIISEITYIDRVKNVQLELSDDKTLRIVFDEYVPYALWCDIEHDGNCVFIDKTGYAFAQSPQLSGGTFVRFLTDLASPEVDAQLFDSARIDEIDELIEVMKSELSIFVTSVRILGSYDIELEVAKGGIVKISQNISFQESLNNLKTILESEEFKHIEPGEFQYIDLRFGDKVFINEEEPILELENEEEPPEDGSATSSSEV